MNNATMLYKYPGSHQIHGNSFDFIIVDEDDVAKEKKEGWSLTTDEAKNKASKKKTKAGEVGAVVNDEESSEVSGQGTAE